MEKEKNIPEVELAALMEKIKKVEAEGGNIWVAELMPKYMTLYFQVHGEVLDDVYLQ
jgi:hypothetical protein